MDPGIIAELVRLVRTSGEVSFRQLWRAAAARGMARWHRTLRRYLDLLVEAEVLSVRRVPSRTPIAKQLYRIRRSRPKVAVGVPILQAYGLNWEGPGKVWWWGTDWEGLARATTLRSPERLLAAAVEDCVVGELWADARRRTGGMQHVIALVGTRPLDLGYLLRRADAHHVGTTMRLLLRRILAIFLGRPRKSDPLLFAEARPHVLRVLRRYRQVGWITLLDTRGQGRLGHDLLRGVQEPWVVEVVAKQAGVA